MKVQNIIDFKAFFHCEGCDDPQRPAALPSAATRTASGPAAAELGAADKRLILCESKSV